MSGVFGPSGIAGAPLTEVKPGESWVANAPLVTPPRAEVHETQAPLVLNEAESKAWTAEFDAKRDPEVAEHEQWKAHEAADQFIRDARAFVGSLS